MKPLSFAQKAKNTILPLVEIVLAQTEPIVDLNADYLS